jgi:hypothetical protein
MFRQGLPTKSAKLKKEHCEEILAELKKEMAKPRIAKSAMKRPAAVNKAPAVKVVS